MKSLDKKLFIGLKYLVILIPLIITLFAVGKAYLVAHETTKLLATEQNENVWQYRDNQYDNYEGGVVMDMWVDSVKYGAFDIHNNFKSTMDAIYNYLPKITVRIGNTNVTTDPITITMAKISNNDNSQSQVTAFNNNIFGQVCHYLYYVVIIELIWVLIVLFKWFIGFSYGLFERKKDL